MTIPNKRLEILPFNVAGGGGSAVLVIPNSEHYTKFAITIPNVANNCVFTLGGCVDGAFTADGVNPDIPMTNTTTIVRQGISSTSISEITYDIDENQTNVFDLIVPLNGGVSISIANAAAGAQEGAIAVYMTGSPFTAGL